MYVQEHKNKSGSTSVYVSVRTKTGNKVIEKFGTSRDENEVRRMKERARIFIEEQKGGSLFDYDVEPIGSAADLNLVLPKIVRGATLVGPDLVYGRLFDKIGYNKIRTRNNELFKSLVVTRLYKPGSKLRTREYMSYFMKKVYDEHEIYRFLDELCCRKDKGMTEEEIEDAERRSVKYQVERITYEQTKSVLGGKVSAVFYDTTTMYFESREDDLRVHGWSKDGKSKNPQVVLGLLVAQGGNPIGYEIHKGNKYEGDTLIPMIRKMEARFGFDKPMVIADAGLLTERNIRALEEDGYEFILGARLKKQKADIKDKILSLRLGNGERASIGLAPERRMVVTMSEARARKNAAERKRRVRRLEKDFESQKLTKENVNGRGYGQFLKMDGEMNVFIDYDAVDHDALFDGLKGYETNSRMSDREIVENYKYLFMIERAMRFNKTDLDIRPVYHRLHNRIDAHVCICFMAYTIMLELDRILKASGSKITVEHARLLSENIYNLNYINIFDQKEMSFLIKDRQYDDEVSELLSIIETACGLKK